MDLFANNPSLQPVDLVLGESTYALHGLEVYNWGPFAGMHRAEIDPRGTAIIGPTGSGKTTLIDGLMTLLVMQPKYNLASTGGHESDRTLIDYVRGVLGGDGSGERDEVTRSAKTITGLCATYSNGEDTLKLAAVLWTDGTSNVMQDLKRRWIFSTNREQSLEQWLRLVHEDGARHLMRHGRETDRLRVFDSKKAYLAHMRKFFDVSENAFTLLNRAAGLKQLNSIDEIFRDLVLDDRSAFERAVEVSAEFDNLYEIHTELETARRQQESLEPIREISGTLEKTRRKQQQWQTLKRILPIWFAMAAEKKWAEQVTILTEKQKEHASRIREEDRLKTDCESRVETLREIYLKLGGNVIGELEKRIEEQTALVEDRKRHATDYCRMAQELGLDAALNEEALTRNKAILKEKRIETQTHRESKQEETLKSMSRQREEEDEATRIESNLKKVKERPGSNIPPQFQDFRTALADQLALNEESLPFLAEMVEVMPQECSWRGAIERAIGSERLRILVPETQMDAALRWVNDRDNRLHVRLQQARPEEGPVEFFPDGFTRKLRFKEHSLRGTVKALLANRDRHCVASPEDLAHTDHAMTVQGLMSDRHGKFEKQDQRRLDEGWMTGFDNKDQLRQLEAQFIEIAKRVSQWNEQTRQLSAELRVFEAQLVMIDRLLDLDFSTINLPGAESDLETTRMRLKELLDPQSDASKAKEQFENEREKLNAIVEGINQLNREVAVIEDNRKKAQSKRELAAEQMGSGLKEEEHILAAKELPIAPEWGPDKLELVEREQRELNDKKLEALLDQVRNLEQRIIRLMEAAQRIDTGALAETGTELEDVPDYLDRLRLLTEEALPEKLNRFLEYLNRSSDQGVTQLLSSIVEEVDGIEQRIAELNRTLTKVDFRSSRYLQLQPQRIRHEKIRHLETAQRQLRSAALKEDQGESHFKALQAVIAILREAGENRRQLGARALLDPRYRLQFFVVEVDRGTGNRSAPRTGSQAGSGGEKELMASHILTASLSYALCPVEATRPLYGTVVLDEAFSKSSPSAASRIIEALRIFGLHPIFVTPNKEIGLLKKHTNKVICVQRPGREASLASISWERLEALAQSK